MQEWIYVNNDDNTSRYVLGTKGDKPVFCFGINPSTAEPNNLDPTLKMLVPFLSAMVMIVGSCLMYILSVIQFLKISNP